MPQPLFFNEIKYVPSFEIAMHRGLWSFIVLSVFLIFLNEIKNFFLLFKSRKKIIILTITSLLIATNWLSFIYSVNIEKIQDASFGYFLTPMISISLGYFFLNEKLNSRKVISVLLMFFACLILVFNSSHFPYISILIGVTWGVYGLLRKQIQVAPALGLLYESGLITLFALPYLVYLNFLEIGFFSYNLNYDSIMLLFTGIITIIPLLLFNLSIKHIPLGLAGVLFYIAPSFHFITSAFIFGENIEGGKFLAFLIIWVGVSIFIYDAIKENNLS